MADAPMGAVRIGPRVVRKLQPANGKDRVNGLIEGCSLSRLGRFPFVKMCLAAVSVAAGAGALLADWNETHIHNPRWTPHAKFHNAQTMSLGVHLSAVILWLLWGRKPYNHTALNWATVAAAT
ncbi:DUF6640 family protein [Streptomyces sp. 8N706]|uniref:DUF6640 family protein n=1 Tax=Streptomyces sp. 8N706 TaxID=3457416 RepID=UPI003FD2960E